MMFTPWGPSAVPTGGAGVASPAGTCSFTTAAMGFAIVPLMSLQLQVVQLDRRRSAEQRDRHPHLALVADHLFHRARKVRERPLGDLHHLPREERDLLLGLLFLHRLLDAEQAIDLLGTQRHRLPAGAHELDHALDAVDRVQRLLVLDHLHEHVPGIDLALHRHLLAVLDLDDFLRRDEGLADRLLLVRTGIVLDPPLDQRPHFVLVPRRRLNRVPAVLGHQKNFATAVTNTNWRIESINPITRPSRMTVVAFLSSSQVGQVTLRISPCTSRRKSTTRPSQLRPVLASASVATTWIPYAAGACCTAGSTSSIPPARSACAGSWW